MDSRLRLFSSIILFTCFCQHIPAIPGLIVPPVMADSDPIGNGLDDLESRTDFPHQGGDVRETIEYILNFVLDFLALIAVIAIIVAGFMLILGFGSESSATRARKIILYTIVGLLIIFFARLIVSIFTVDLASVFP